MAGCAVALMGSVIRTADGTLGTLDDLLFDEQTWQIRGLVVQPTDLAPANQAPAPRRVLNPDAAQSTDWQRQEIRFAATRNELLACPPWGFKAGPAVGGEGSRGLAATPGPHAASVRKLLDMPVQASDGFLGRLVDLLIDAQSQRPRSWPVRFLVVESGGWLYSKRLLVDPQWVSAIEWSVPRVQIALARGTVLASPEFDPAVPFDREYESRLYDYFGQPH